MAKFEEMQAFVKTVETASLSEAARELNVSPSAISKQIKNLENRLGARLIQRTTRTLALTEPGKSFYEQSVAIITQVDRAETGVHELQDEPQGTLRISASADFSRLHLSSAIANFAKQYPGLRLEWNFTDRTIDLITENYDVAIRIGALPDSTMIAHKLSPCRHVVCASPQYLKDNGSPAVPDELREHECIGYEYRMDTRLGWHFEVDKRPQTVHVNGRLRTNTGWMIRELMLAHLGIGLVPTFMVADDLRAGKLVALLDNYLRADTAIYVVYMSRAHLSAKVRVFIDFLVDHCSPEPEWDKY